jgi:hypothetical protein
VDRVPLRDELYASTVEGRSTDVGDQLLDVGG